MQATTDFQRSLEDDYLGTSKRKQHRILAHSLDVKLLSGELK